MDIPSINTFPPGGAQPAAGSASSFQPAATAPGAAGGASSTDPGSGSGQAASAGSSASAPTSAAAQVPAGEVHKAVDKLNQQLAQTGNSATLKVGLDSDGQHPGQVLVELSDPATKQVYFKRYVPTEQVTQAAEPSSSGGTGQAGVLLSTKA